MLIKINSILKKLKLQLFDENSWKTWEEGSFVFVFFQGQDGKQGVTFRAMFLVSILKDLDIRS